MLVTPACYAHITQKLMSIAHNKVVAILEVLLLNILTTKLKFKTNMFRVDTTYQV